MAIDLVDLVKGYLTPDVVLCAAGHVEESPAATQKALVAIVPTVVGALATKAAAPDGAQQVARMLESECCDGRVLGDVSSLFRGGIATQFALGNGKSLLEWLFESRIGDVTSALARFAGVRMSSMTSLLALAAPLVMHVVGRQREAMGTSATALAGLLDAQRGTVARLLPAGLGSLLGWPWLPSRVIDVGIAMAGAATRVRLEVFRRRWMSSLALLVALVAGLLLWLSWPTAPGRAPARALSELELPGGARVSVPEGGLNFSLIKWLAAAGDTSIPKRFVFDDLEFEPASTQLTADSMATVSTLVAVLGAYPSVTVTLEGHTDSSGDPAANKALSIDRALAVKELMVTAGIAESRIQSGGWGQDKPVATNGTAEGRARNRRLELLVVKR